MQLIISALTLLGVAAYLTMEYQELIYTPKRVVESVKEFIDSPSDDLYFHCILQMRSDLSSKQADLTLAEVRLKNSKD